tara:strand:- start:465293 stop:465667 length:375 start_codon:yes stop_codon:yes gene_type:complete
MEDWKNKLIELIPEEREEWESEFSIYLAFGTIRGLVEDAARDSNDDLLGRCFAFAQWCFDQEEKDLWNSAGVSFYEHLADDPSVERIVHRFVKRKTFEDIRGLIEVMGKAGAAKRIEQRYSNGD